MPKLVECSDCFYFEKLKGDSERGTCLRHPPRVLLDIDFDRQQIATSWCQPTVTHVMSCGDGFPTARSLGGKLAEAFKEMEKVRR